MQSEKRHCYYCGFGMQAGYGQPPSPRIALFFLNEAFSSFASTAAEQRVNGGVTMMKRMCVCDEEESRESQLHTRFF